MLRTGIADQLREDEVADGYLRPDYDEYAFHRVPGTAASLLGVDAGPTLPEDAAADAPDDPAHVVFLFVDAYGWDAYSGSFTDAPFFDSVTEAVRVTPLTSPFPSETGACVPTAHTGLPPVEHGLLGWNGYDPESDRVYQTLPFQTADGEEPELDPDALFDGDTIYPALDDAGVDAHVVEPAALADSVVRPDRPFHGYETTAEFAVTLRETIERADAPSYTYAYYPEVDGVAHRHGPTSARHDAQVASLGGALARELEKLDADTAAETAVCLVADHGQVATPPAANRTLPDDVVAAVETDADGTPVVTGGPRNVHLHLRDDADPDAVRDDLAALDALVLSREDALDADLWGPGDPGPAFDRNCGDLLVVPRNYSLWHAGDARELQYEGMHGGLHPDEALVPFATFALADVV